jgi:hypothetical protein
MSGDQADVRRDQSAQAGTHSGSAQSAAAFRAHAESRALEGQQPPFARHARIARRRRGGRNGGFRASRRCRAVIPVLAASRDSRRTRRRQELMCSCGPRRELRPLGSTSRPTRLSGRTGSSGLACPRRRRASGTSCAQYEYEPPLHRRWGSTAELARREISWRTARATIRPARQLSHHARDRIVVGNRPTARITPHMARQRAAGRRPSRHSGARTRTHRTCHCGRPGTGRQPLGRRDARRLSASG